MIRGTTPTHIFETDVDLRDFRIYISYKQRGSVIVEKTNEDCEITATQVSVKLSQEDTLKFNIDAPVRIQIRAVVENGDAIASDIIDTPAREILKDGVIEYANS